MFSEIKSTIRLRKHLRSESGEFLRKVIKKKAIFIHIPKAAGKSILQSVYGIDMHRSLGHATSFVYRDLLGKKKFSSYYKFAFVRNPRDRLRSAFYFAKSGGFGFRTDRDLEKEIADLSFESFVTTWLNREKLEQWVLFRDQSHYLFDEAGRCAVDDIFYFEEIEKGYEIIQEKVNVESALIRSNVSGRDRKSLESYTPEMEDAVKALYGHDFRNLGYQQDQR